MLDLTRLYSDEFQFLGTLTGLIVLLVLLLPVLYFYSKKWISSNSYDPHKFYDYPITEIQSIGVNGDKLGVQAFYIGKINGLKNNSRWSVIVGDLISALNTNEAFDPELYRNDPFPDTDSRKRRRMRNWSQSSFLPGANLLGVQYQDGKFQFAQLLPLTNDIYEAIVVLKRFKTQGVSVDGDYEKLKDTPEQFTAKRWLWIILITALVTIAFILSSVYVVGCLDNPGSNICLIKMSN